MKNKFTISASTRNSILAAISLAFWAQACGDPSADTDEPYEGVSLGSAEQALAVDAVGTQATPVGALQSSDLADATDTADFERLVAELEDQASRSRRDFVSAGADTEPATVFVELDKGKFKKGCQSASGSFVENRDGSFQCNLRSGGVIKCADTASRCTYTER